MASPEPTAGAATPPARLPLFYRKPVALTANLHADLQLKGGQDFRFAAATNAAPIMDVEFAQAMGAYPIVFVGEPVHPICVLGLERHNLFVDGQGQWAAGRYIPAYVRRYPFVFIEMADKAQFALGVDIACERLTAQAEQSPPSIPLFVDGQPSPLTLEAMKFSSALQAQQLATRAFCEALVAQDLLIDQQANGTLAGGKPFNVQGFRIVDAARFQALADEVVVDWHRKGWLALVHQHLASLRCWRDLLDRQGAADRTATTANAETPGDPVLAD